VTSESNNRALPTERIAPAARSTILVTITVVFASGILLNQLVRGALLEQPRKGNPTYAAFDVQWKRLDSVAEELDTLILGDSSGRHGLDPAGFDRIVGGRSLNFCTMGNAGVINPAWQLEAYLSHWPAPKRVLLVIVHNVWPRELRPQLAGRVPLSWGYWDRLRAKEHYSAQEQWTVFENRHIPLLSQHETISRLALYPWDAQPRRIGFTETGFSPIPKPRPERVARDRRWQIKTVKDQSWAASEQSARSLAAMMALAEERGFKLHLALPPLNRGLYSNSDFRSYYEGYVQGLRELIAGHLGTQLLSDTPPLYDDDEMQNTDHLIADLSPAYTEHVAHLVSLAESHPE